MPGKLKEGYLAGLGIAVITYEKASDISKKLVEKGELAKEKQKKFITTLMSEAKKNTSEMVKILNEKIGNLAEKGKPLKEKQDKLVKDIASKTKETSLVTEAKLKELVREAKEKTMSVKDKISGNDEEKIRKALEDLDIPTKEDLEEIRNKLDILIAELAKKEPEK